MHKLFDILFGYFLKYKKTIFSTSNHFQCQKKNLKESIDIIDDEGADAYAGS